MTAPYRTRPVTGNTVRLDALGRPVRYMREAESGPREFAARLPGDGRWPTASAGVACELAEPGFLYASRPWPRRGADAPALSATG
ncbi:hypothetical protein [Streptomyces sp. NPDC003393]